MTSRRLRLLLSSIVVLLALASTLPSSASAQDRDCADFSNQAEAQQFFVEQGGPEQDPHRLDDIGQGNGVACEALPCPCSNSMGGGGGGGGQQPARRARPPIDFAARITRVVDGDTVKVRNTATGQRYTIRLIGIDTPEVVHPRVADQCGGAEASRVMKRLAPRGRRVRVTGDSTQGRRDRHGRLLAYVRLRGGPQLNLAQVRRGWSTAYIYRKRFKLYRRFRRAERAARAAARGVWGLCGGNFDSRLRDGRPADVRGFRPCDGGWDPGGRAGNFFRELAVVGDSCRTARGVLREWTRRAAADDPPNQQRIQTPIRLLGWTCGGAMRQGTGNPYFEGGCVRDDGRATLRFLGLS